MNLTPLRYDTHWSPRGKHLGKPIQNRRPPATPTIQKRPKMLAANESREFTLSVAMHCICIYTAEVRDLELLRTWYTLSVML